MRGGVQKIIESVHKTHIVFENLSNINGDMLQRAWGLNIGEDSTIRICVMVDHPQ